MFSSLDFLTVSLDLHSILPWIEFCLNLLAAIFLAYDGDGQGKIDLSILQALQGKSNEVILASPAYQSQEPVKAAKLRRDIPKGPYFFSPSTGEIYQAFRLYSDHQLAFTEAAISDGKDGYKPLPAVTEVNKLLTGWCCK